MASGALIELNKMAKLTERARELTITEERTRRKIK
jgi:hypothetical protein